jgi:glyoxylase-like metal-dependent hydrolase (beta-lactamase superfamily II)
MGTLVDSNQILVGRTLIADTFLLCGSGTVIVDTGYAGSLSIIIQALENAKRTLDDISLILITHGHTDHFGCAAELKKLSWAPVAIHHLDATFLVTGKNPEIKLTRKVRPWAMERFVGSFREHDMEVAPVTPDIYIDDNLDLQEFGIEGWAVHTPGHTSGSISVVLDNGTALAGDLIVPHPFNTGKPVLPLYGEDENLIKKGLNRLLGMGVKTFYSSHGGVFNSEQVKELARASSSDYLTKQIDGKQNV